jgi:hypothetical protein
LNVRDGTHACSLSLRHSQEALQPVNGVRPTVTAALA